MKIIEQEEFFKTFNEKGMTYDQWLKTFEKEENKEKITKQFQDSEFLRESCRIKLQELNYKQYLLVIVADWCGDCHRNAPILEHIAKSSEHLELRFLKKEDNLDLLIKSNNGEKIPYVMFYSPDGYFVDNWAERSYETHKLLSESFKKSNYEINEEFFKSYTETVEKEKQMIYQSNCDELVHLVLKVNAILGTSKRLNKVVQ